MRKENELYVKLWASVFQKAIDDLIHKLATPYAVFLLPQQRPSQADQPRGDSGYEPGKVELSLPPLECLFNYAVSSLWIEVLHTENRIAFHSEYGSRKPAHHDPISRRSMDDLTITDVKHAVDISGSQDQAITQRDGREGGDSRAREDDVRLLQSRDNGPTPRLTRHIVPEVLNQ